MQPFSTLYVYTLHVAAARALIPGCDFLGEPQMKLDHASYYKECIPVQPGIPPGTQLLPSIYYEHVQQLSAIT